MLFWTYKTKTKEDTVSTADLAKALHASKEATLKQLTREKDKGTVDGNSQEGWLGRMGGSNGGRMGGRIERR